MRLIDSNVLAYAFYDNAHTEVCQEAIRTGGVIDTFNLVEAFFIIEKEVNREHAQKAIRGLLKSALIIVDVTPDMIFETLKRTKQNMSIFDLLHYACAVTNNCTSVLSYDNDFDGCDIPREEP